MSPFILPLLLLAAAAPPADLATSVSFPSPGAGGVHQASVVVRNAGPGDAPGVRLRVRLGAGATLVSATASPGRCQGAVCDLAAIAAGGEASVLLVARVAPGMPFSVLAEAGSDVGDPTPADASARSTDQPAAASAATRAAARLTASRRGPRTVAGGARIVVRGRLLAAAGAGGQRITVTLASPWWPRLGATRSARSDAAGRFAISLWATVSGTLTARFAGSRALGPAGAALGALRVRPAILARFAGRPGAAGSFTAIRATGRFAPAAAGEGATLGWQAWNGRRWATVGGDADAVRVHAGRLRGTLRIGPLRRSNRYRLVYEPLNRAPLAAAVSAGAGALR